MKNLIKLHSVLSEKYITITWFVSSKCNYKCYYCTDYLNSGTTFSDKYDNVLIFIKQIQTKYPDKIIRLLFMGGEISLWKQFYSFTKDAKQLKNIEIIIISNGSFSLKWIKKNLKYLDFILISYHHQFASKEHFINISKIIKHKGHVLLMMPHKKFQEVLDIGVQISKEAKIFVSAKLLRINFKDNFYPYKKEDLENNRFIGLKYFPYNLLGLMKGAVNAILNNKTIGNLHNVDLVKLNYNKLLNWKCYGGIENFFINDDGNVFVGQCRRGLLGNIHDNNLSLPDKPFICNKSQCNCNIDLDSSTKIKGK